MSTMSSRRMTCLSVTSPMMFMTSEELASGGACPRWQAHAQLLGKGAGAGHAAHVGGDDDHLVLPAVKAVVEIVGENGVAQQIVHGDVEEA